jgi:hypothetical protein
MCLFFHVFWVYSVLLSTDFMYSRIPVGQGRPYVQIGVLQFVLRVQFYVKLNVRNLYVTNQDLFSYKLL